MQVPLLDLKGQFASLKQEIMKEIEELSDSQMFILGARPVPMPSPLRPRPPGSSP